MDYKDTIDTFFNKISIDIIKKFKEYNKLERSFEHACTKIRQDLTDKKYKNLIGINNDVFTKAIYDFNHFEDNYKKGASVSLVIENEIRTEYTENIITKEIVDNERKAVLDYPFDNFVKDLIEYDSLGRIEMRLSINAELFKLFYESNIYDQFTLESFNGHVVNSLLYKNLFSMFKPGIPIPVAVKKIDEFQNVYYDINLNPLELNELENNVILKDKIKKQIFEIDEQLLILNLCLEDKNSIPLTEKSKLIILIGEITEDNLFKVPSSDSKTYSKISNGVWRQGSKKTMIQTIDNILTKIENYRLNITNQTLKKHRATLKNEQKNI